MLGLLNAYIQLKRYSQTHHRQCSTLVCSAAPAVVKLQEEARVGEQQAYLQAVPVCKCIMCRACNFHPVPAILMPAQPKLNIANVLWHSLHPMADLTTGIHALAAAAPRWARRLWEDECLLGGSATRQTRTTMGSCRRRPELESRDRLHHRQQKVLQATPDCKCITCRA